MKRVGASAAGQPGSRSVAWSDMAFKYPRRSLMLSASLACLMIPASPVFAQASAGAEEATSGIEEITVTGSHLGRIVRDFIEMATMPSPIGQVSRWKVPICPKTTGMRPAFTDFVSKRIREIARDIGAPANANESCSPNLQIIFTEHPQAMLEIGRAHV